MAPAGLRRDPAGARHTRRAPRRGLRRVRGARAPARHGHPADRRRRARPRPRPARLRAPRGVARSRERRRLLGARARRPVGAARPARRSAARRPHVPPRHRRPPARAPARRRTAHRHPSHAHRRRHRPRRPERRGPRPALPLRRRRRRPAPGAPDVLYDHGEPPMSAPPRVPRTRPEPVAPDPAVPEPAVPEPTLSELAVSEPAAAEALDAHEEHAWSRCDPWSAALRSGRGPLYLHREDGTRHPLDIERWCAAPDAADRTVIERCRGSVLDIGCGPGRFLVALAERRLTALGIDANPHAVARAVRAGGGALCRSVFAPLPGTGSWHTALLVDGNIGIGGDPPRLLRRTAELVRPGGTLLVETAAHALDERLSVRVGDGRGVHGTAFPWARLGSTALLRHAEETGAWAKAGEWEAGGRRFVALRRA
ncbi:methyltransferase domain-containing protein [Streptomyces sp. SID4945]|nr:methyltransferase domain-containing protein [Streptomyces sp. SID4945]